jgi:hypothetical protein
MASFVLGALKTQLISLVETHSDELEGALRTSLIKMKESHPEEVAIFLQNWVKLNNAVKETLALAPPAAVAGRRRKRTKKRSRK